MFVLINLLKKLRDFKKYFKLHLKHFYFCLNPFFDNQAYIQYFFVHASKVSSFKTKKNHKRCATFQIIIFKANLVT